MVIVNNKIIGDKGAIEVIRLVNCPNCGKKLMVLPNSFPLFDLQCTACQFRAQVKSNNTRPKDVVRGAGWDIVAKVIKSGYLVPPLILNFKWKVKNVEKQEIRFYPFIKKENLIKYTADIKSIGRRYKMFNYNLKSLKFYLLFSK
jgi:ssDNA-binding Zn-finger/Zn-ribbon topoisomerase 1